MFSATMPPKIGDLAKRILKDPEEIRLAVSRPADRIDQQFYLARDEQKLPLLMHLLKGFENISMVLFTSRKSNVEPIVRALRKLGLGAHGIHRIQNKASGKSCCVTLRTASFRYS